jgi:hypothetical protein
MTSSEHQVECEVWQSGNPHTCMFWQASIRRSARLGAKSWKSILSEHIAIVFDPSSLLAPLVHGPVMATIPTRDASQISTTLVRSLPQSFSTEGTLT